jgi:solute carrier family 25 carnitine/acylcarnitine transporter 20/29
MHLTLPSVTTAHSLQLNCRTHPNTTISPLSQVKARQQVQAPTTGAAAAAATGMVGTARSILSNEGFRGLYRGLVPPLLSLSILNTLNFTLYSYFQSLYYSFPATTPRGQKSGSLSRSSMDRERYDCWQLRNAGAGATVGIFAGFVSTVENLVKTQLQLDNVRPQPRYTGSLDCVRQLVRCAAGEVAMDPSALRARRQLLRGVQILYTGHGVNTLREMTFLATYFGLYEVLRDSLYYHHHTTLRDDPADAASHRQCSSGPLWTIPLAGGISGAVAWIVSFPLDCVRAGVHGQDLFVPPPHKRRTARDVFRRLVHTRGIFGLYSGVTPSILRAFLVSGSRFTAYETSLWFLRGGRDKY